ncbi:MAG: hypothetical protein V4623_03840 [Pseudomonadota bacterium]
MSQQSIFADGIGHIVMMNGMVRIQFVTASHAEKDGHVNASFDPQCAVVLTPQAFLQSFRKMEDIIKKMTAAGILVKRGEERREGPARDTTALSADKTEIKPDRKKAKKLN